MNKKLSSLLISFITLLFLITFFTKSNLFIESFFQAIKLWFYHLLPSIFIFFTITDILNNYHFPYYISLLIGNIIHKIYHLPKESSYIILMSMTSGFPGNSKLIKDGLDNKYLNEMDANKLLTMTHFSNPLFIIYTIGITFFHSQRIGLIILLAHFITNFIIGFIFRNIYHHDNKIINYQLKKTLPFMSLLKTSINNTISILLNVLGIIIFFSLIITFINNYLNLNPFSNTILNGLLEITNGLSLLSTLSLSIIKKAVLATFFISFGGFSIHLQIKNILSEYNMNYYLYLLARLIHASISSLITWIILINS